MLFQIIFLLIIRSKDIYNKNISELLYCYVFVKLFLYFHKYKFLKVIEFFIFVVGNIKNKKTKFFFI